MRKWKLPVILTCAELDQFIVDYLDGKLSLGQRLKFRFHILLCPKCSAFLDEYKKTVELEKRAFIPRDKQAIQDAPEDLIRAILAARPRG